MMAGGSDAKLIPPLTDAESCSGSYTGAQGHRTKGDDDSLPQLGKTGFNFLFIKRLFKILKVLFPKFLSKTLLFCLFFLFVRASAEYNYYNTGLIPSTFYASLTGHEHQVFKESVYQSVIIVVSACICKSAVDLVAYVIYVRWRSLLTRHLQTLYFKDLNYYRLNVIEKVVDNPDQRITQDVERFCNELAIQIIPKLALWPFVTCYYTYKTFVTMGYIGVLAIYGLFIISTTINKFLMGPVISRIVTQEKREGDFRFHHVQVRSNSESIAFYDGGSLEAEKARALMGKLFSTQLSLAHWTFPLNFSVNLFDYLSSVITYIVLGIIIFSGGYDHLSPSALAGKISEVAFFSLYLLNNFSILVDQSSNIADLAGYTHRIGHLIEVLNNLNKLTSAAKTTIVPSIDLSDSISSNDDLDDSYNNRSQTIRYSIADPGPIVAAVFEDVTIAPPGCTDIPLVEGLSFKFERGKNILISGTSGSGKSSILRVLKKLWQPLKGNAYICLIEANTEVMFIPQKPHLTMGSLADQVTYPHQPKELNDTTDNLTDYVLFENRINEALRLACLLSLKERLGGVDVIFDGNWNDYVSPGEMQKIAFARLFYHKPSFAILDEVTSALSEEDEHYFYTSIHQMGTTVLSIGHRSSIKQYHQVRVTLTEQGQWKLDRMN